jgi:hypothetical protein
MAKAHLHHYPCVSQCLFKFHRNDTLITWHPASHDSVHGCVNFDQFPRRNTSTLIALEDLGRGATGHAWLCVTTSSPHSAVCVLKFSNTPESWGSLENECDNWRLIYPEFSGMTSLHKWSGSEALMMSHCAPIPPSERDDFRDAIKDLLLERFGEKYVHPDVAWRNIGQYKRLVDGERMGVVPVVFDLCDVREYVIDQDAGWIACAMNKLYPAPN